MADKDLKRMRDALRALVEPEIEEPPAAHYAARANAFSCWSAHLGGINNVPMVLKTRDVSVHVRTPSSVECRRGEYDRNGFRYIASVASLTTHVVPALGAEVNAGSIVAMTMLVHGGGGLVARHAQVHLFSTIAGHRKDTAAVVTRALGGGLDTVDFFGKYLGMIDTRYPEAGLIDEWDCIANGRTRG